MRVAYVHQIEIVTRHATFISTLRGSHLRSPPKCGYVVGHKKQSMALNFGGRAAWRIAPEAGSHDEMVARKLFDLRRRSFPHCR